MFFYFRFEICRKLGQGTYGKVQLGINKETGQQVGLIFIKYLKNVLKYLIYLNQDHLVTSMVCTANILIVNTTIFYRVSFIVVIWS
jgi:serine/threonine protein kinase